MLDIGLFSIWGGLLLFEQHPLRTLSAQVKGVLFVLLWVVFWFLISLIFPTLFESYIPQEQHARVIEQLINISIAVFAYLAAWIVVATSFRKMMLFNLGRGYLWFSYLIAWKVVIFNPIYSLETSQTLLLAMTFILASIFVFVQSRSVSLSNHYQIESGGPGR